MAHMERAGRGANLATGPVNVLSAGNDTEFTRPLIDHQAETLARRFAMSIPHARAVAALAFERRPRR